MRPVLLAQDQQPKNVLHVLLLLSSQSISLLARLTAIPVTLNSVISVKVREHHIQLVTHPVSHAKVQELINAYNASLPYSILNKMSVYLTVLLAILPTKRNNVKNATEPANTATALQNKIVLDATTLSISYTKDHV